MYKWYRKETGAGDVASALLLLASGGVKLKFSPDDLAQEICLGVRFGLFGAGASDYASIESVASTLADRS